MKLGHLSSTIRRLFLLASAHSVSQGPAAVSLDPSFAAFLPQVEQADHRFINGDPSARLAQVSRREDATIFGGWSAYEKGRSQVGPRYQWAATDRKNNAHF